MKSLLPLLSRNAAILLPVLLLALQACEFSTANIERAVMARSVNDKSEPLEETSTFHGSEPLLHCSVLMANTPADTPVKAVWYQKTEEGKVILDSSKITMDGDGWIDFTLTLSNSMLPYGEYAVDLSIGSTFAQTVPFTIEPMYPDSPVREAVVARAISESSFPTEPTWVFDAGTTTVYAPIYVAGQDAGTVFAAKWYVHDATGDRTEIDTYELPFDEKGWIGFQLNLPDGLAPGRYSVDILVDDMVEHTLEFRAE